MRSFGKKILSASAWAVPVLAAVLPDGPKPAVSRPEGNILELDLQQNYAQATFSVPCAGCLGHSHHTSHDDESIILSFKTHASDQPCGASNVTLNGVYLPQEWNGDFASGSGSYTGVTDFEENAWFLRHDLDLEWESACLHGDQEADDAAQVLTVNIKAIDGKPIDNPSGFTVSFKQSSPPELLRLEAVPNRSASEKEQAESWRKPPAHLRLILSPPKDRELDLTDGPNDYSLEDEIRELKALQTEAEQLQKAIQDKKKYIHSQLKKETQSFKEELKQCDSITCVLKTLAHGAHGAWRVIYVRFRPNNRESNLMGRPEDDPYQRVYNSGNQKQAEGHVTVDSSPHPPQMSRLPHPASYAHPPLPPPPHANDFPPPPPPPYVEGLPPPPPPHADGFPPPPPPPPPPHMGGIPPPPPPPPRPHHGPPHMPRPDSPYVIALEAVLGILCCGCLFTIIRHRCSSLRTRTERAAAREERRNERAYRRAARKHAWRNWWRGNWRDQERIDDYEEKRSLIQNQESILEGVMQEEIRQLRAAHGVVNDIVRAEEGRVPSCGSHAHVHCHYAHPVPPEPYSPISTASTYPPTSLPELPSRPLSRTDSLPGYRSDSSSSPPAYEEDEDLSDTVANGFRQYSASSTSSVSSRWTPDSSVIDVSPRPSADTLRYVETAFTETSYSETSYAETTVTGVGEKN